MRTIRCDLTETQAAACRDAGKCVGGLNLPLPLAQRITVEPGTGCWRVAGHGNGKGHKKVRLFGVMRQFHRVVWQILKGEIPAGKVLDHIKELCKNRDCCNPGHLEPVSVAENTFRGEAPLYR